MMRTLWVVTALAGLSAAGAAGIAHKGGPSNLELEADIASTRAEIAAADAEASQYSGGLVLAQVQLRRAVLNNTLAMLEQKRKSFLRGITLSYQEPTPRVSASCDDVNASLELAKARADATAAQQEATTYSGGLIQAMALMRAATAKATEAAIEQRVAFMKLDASKNLSP